jgi:hypothetical protein
MDKVLLGKLNVKAVYIAWWLTPAILISCFSIYFLSKEHIIIVFFTLLGCLLFFSLAHIILAQFVRCPHCQKALTIQGLKPPHENARCIGPQNGWPVVIKQWSTGSVVCIHCGDEVNTNAL